MEFGKLKVTELRKQLGDLGLDTTGLKADLVERLTSYTDLPADTTYKLLYQRYPVLMAGTTDKARAYHAFGIAVCSNERTSAYEFIFSAIKRCAHEMFGHTYLPYLPYHTYLHARCRCS